MKTNTNLRTNRVHEKNRKCKIYRKRKIYRTHKIIRMFVLIICVVVGGSLFIECSEYRSQLGLANEVKNHNAVTLMDIYSHINKLDAVEGKALEIQKDGFGFNITNNLNKDIRILQIADTHFSGRSENYQKNIMAIDAVYTIVQDQKPDFIVVTGDLIFGTSYTDSKEDEQSLKIAFALMDRIGIPWTWTFGNHDHDFFDRYDDSEIENMIKKSKTLLMADKNPSINGYSNTVFKVYNKNKDLYSAFFILDSNSSIYNENSTEADDYEGISANQVEWYSQQLNIMKRKNGMLPTTFVYFHIPINEYKDSWELLNNNDMVYNKSGTQREKVSCSSKRSNLFETMVNIGSTKAVFCGHDHLNDSIVEYNGIDLVYGKSIDYTAYPGIEQEVEQRGASILTINMEGQFEIENKRLIDCSGIN